MMPRWLAGLLGFVVVFAIWVEVMDSMYGDREGPLWKAILKGWRPGC